MAKQRLASMSVDALLKLRDDIASVLSQKADELKDQLARLGGGGDSVNNGRRRAHSLKGRKAAIKYRDKAGNTWSGRGAQARWLTEAVKAGAKREDFLVDKSAVNKAPRKKRRKRKKLAARKQGQVRTARKKKSRPIARKKRQAPGRRKQQVRKAVAREKRQNPKTKIQKQIVPTTSNQTVEASAQRAESPTE
jgi:DNA-binding protein H-NS